MNFKMNKTLLMGVAAILVALGIFIAWYNSASNTFRCPNDYATEGAYVTGVTGWASGELVSAPNMTAEELRNKREALFKEHHCAPSRWPTLPGGF